MAADETISNSPPVTFPTVIEVPVVFKIKVHNTEVLEYYKSGNGINAVADIMDIIDDQLFGTIESINGLTPEEIRRKLQAVATATP